MTTNTTTTAKPSARDRILERIATAYPCTSVDFLVCDLHLAPITVARVLVKLAAAGLIETDEPEPGYARNYRLTDEATRQRLDERAFRASLESVGA